MCWSVSRLVCRSVGQFGWSVGLKPASLPCHCPHLCATYTATLHPPTSHPAHPSLSQERLSLASSLAQPPPPSGVSEGSSPSPSPSSSSSSSRRTRLGSSKRSLRLETPVSGKPPRSARAPRPPPCSGLRQPALCLGGGPAPRLRLGAVRSEGRPLPPSGLRPHPRSEPAMSSEVIYVGYDTCWL